MVTGQPDAIAASESWAHTWKLHLTESLPTQNENPTVRSYSIAVMRRGLETVASCRDRADFGHGRYFDVVDRLTPR